MYWKQEVTHLKNKNRSDYFANKFEISKNNPMKTWSTIKEAMNNGIPAKTTKINIAYGSNLTTTDSEAAEILNDYFSTVGSKMASKIASNYYNFETNSLDHPKLTEFIPLTETGIKVIVIVKNLNNTSSSGSDGISIRTIKAVLSIE